MNAHATISRAWSLEREGHDIAPLHTVDLEDEGEILTWLTNGAFVLESSAQETTYLKACMHLGYRGYFDTNLIQGASTRGGSAVGLLQAAEPKRMTLNHYRSHIEQSIDKITKLPTDILPYPATDEVADKNGALVVKQILAAFSYRARAPKFNRQVVRSGLVTGEGWGKVFWNRHIGEEQRDVKAAISKKVKVRRISEDGKVTQETLDRAPRIGDVDLKHLIPWNVFILQEAPGEPPIGIFYKELMHRETVKKRFEIEELSEGSGNVNIYDVNSMVYRISSSLVEVWSFHHRRTEDLPDGFEAQFIDGQLLSYGPLTSPIQDDSELGDLPFVRFSAVDSDADEWCQPTSIDMVTLQHAINQLTTIQRRNAWYGANPRVLSQKGTTRREDWVNSPTFLEYNGDKPPTLMTFPLLSQELFALRNQFVAEQREFAGNFGASRGDPPPNTRSAEQLAFYAEEEQKRAGGPIGRFREFVLEYNKKALSLMSVHYKKDDGRMMLMLGKSEEPMLRPYDVSVLAKSWNVRLATGDNLSMSPTLRMEQLIRLRQVAPSLLSDEEFADKAQLGTIDKVYTVARAAISLADYEEQAWQEGKDVPEPEIFQEHIVHWTRHRKFMQTLSFISQPKARRQIFIDHQLGHEYQMFQLALGNPIYAQRVMQLEGYPMFYVPPQPLYQALALPPAEGVAPPQQTQSAPQPMPAIPGQTTDEAINELEMSNG